MHTTVIIFQNENARKQLLEKGFVYTFRVKMHKTGKDWATDKRCGKKIADVIINGPMEINSAEDLIAYANASGFAKVSDWVDAIKQKYPAIKGYLFGVSRIT